MPQVRLKKARERSLRRRHPWLYSGAIHSVTGDPQSGDIVRVVDEGGAFLAWGYFNASSKIQVRVLEWRESSVIDDEWWRGKLRRAIELRRSLLPLSDSDAIRLVYSEADGVPGLIVDRYAGYAVVQILTAGIERVRSLVLELLEDLIEPMGIYERSDTDIRELEGLPPVSGLVGGEMPPDLVLIREHENEFYVDMKGGQKTGFYIDQRENRGMVSRYAADREVLDLFSYTGAFAVCAATAGAARVTVVESSADALDIAKRNFEKNGVPLDHVETVHGSAFDVVRTYRDGARHFDVVICDPPKLAQTKMQLAKAERAYKDINLLAMKILRPNGTLVTFSCSRAVNVGEFSKIVAWASIDAGREIQILHRLSQAPDHPVNPCFPESEYLTGLVCRVL